MINKITNINEDQLQSMIVIGLETINHKNLYVRKFTKNDINTLVSNNGVDLIIELHHCKTTISVIDSNHKAKNLDKIDILMSIMNSPRAEGVRYQVHLNSDLILFMHGNDRKTFQNRTDSKINFYDDNFNLVFVQESFYCFNYNDNKFNMNEVYLGYDFDEHYNPLGKMCVSGPKGDYKTMNERYESKLRVYRDSFNIEDEQLMIKQYLLMDMLDNFDEIFTQFYGPLPQAFDMELLKAQFELSSIILFN